jgi:hypothetical protein
MLLPAALAIGLSVGCLPPSSAEAATVLWANVNAKGNLDKGEGATSAKQQSKGTYLVFFERNVSKCNYGISLVSYGITLVKPSATDKNSVLVGIIDTQSEDFQDTAFYLQVICP